MDDATIGRQGAQTEGPDGVRGALRIVALVLAGALQLLVGFFTTTAIGLIGVPRWAFLGLAGLWLAGVLLLVWTARHKPFGAPLVPLANGLLSWAVITAGEAWLGWMP